MVNAGQFLPPGASGASQRKHSPLKYHIFFGHPGWHACGKEPREQLCG
jgi:hypothetical protein